ncbi:LANO_0C01420g1_1 [Lachancea nothofagi CBS 11611]|uniref:LANO_0C01420g1_1 n=1 Tax=Lachancea nothofagi CBS 11611 TaxID=1266666 RepID=A0A1G4J485_9SACH|nr:LANO_0C01420g1_1 [Lachancea nothofagi CBS 11611]
MLRNKTPVLPLQSFTARILGGAKLIERVNQISLVSGAKALSQTDIWLNEALANKNYRLRNNKVFNRNEDQIKGRAELFLNVVLGTLRELRLTKKVELYYILLNRLQSSRISWVSKSGSYIVGQTPVELYRELSYMLRSQCTNNDERADMMCLTKFTLQLLKSYVAIFKIRDNLVPDTIFLRNCAEIVGRAGSIHYLHKFVELVDDPGLEAHAYISFYLHTGQTAHLVTFLRSSPLLETQLEPNSLTQLLHQCVHRLVCLGLEDDAQTTFELLMKQAPSITPQSLSSIKFVTEKYGAFKVQLALSKNIEDADYDVPIPWKTFQKDLTFGAYIGLLDESGVDFFNESQAMDFLLTKLPTHDMSVEQWGDYFEETSPRRDASASLKAFHLNIILTHVAAHKSLGFVILIWRHLIVELRLLREFVDSHYLCSSKNQNGFHVLLRAVGNSSAAKLAGYELFKYLKAESTDSITNSGSYFELTNKDYVYLMRSTLWGPERKAIHLYLYHFFLNLGETCIITDGRGRRSWQLPPSVAKLLMSPYLEHRNSQELGRISQLVADWHLDNGCKIPETQLQDIFGAAYVEELSPQKLLKLETQNREERENEPSLGGYSLIADWENAARIREVLKHLRST